MYLEQGAVGAPTTLYKIDTSANPFNFVPQGTATITYNAVGYNPIDNYQYGILNTSNHLVRIAADGSAVDLGAVTGLPSATYISGTFSDTGGFLYVKSNVATSTATYVINVSTKTATLLNLTFPAGMTSLSIADWAWVNGLLYSVTNAGQLVSINPTTGVVTAIGAPNGLPAGFLGAMYGAPDGLFGSGNNPPSGFYQFNLTTGAATLISGAPGSQSNDGSNCASQNIVFGVDLSITKTDNQAQYIAGSNVTYTIVVKNTGPFGAQGVTVADPLPAGITSASWTCGSATGGAVCGTASGSGALNDFNASLPYSSSGSSLTYTVTLAVPSTFTGNLTNVATVTPGPASINAGAACTAAGSTFNAATGQCTASDTDTRTLPVISISKSANIGSAALLPNSTVTYFVDISNTGVALANGTVINDPIPAGIASFNSWACAPTAGSAVISPSSGTGAVSTTISSFPAGATVRCTINATVASNSPAAVVNTATAAPNNGGLCAPGNTPSPCNASVSNPSAPQLNITKTATPSGPYLPGQPLGYTIMVTNAGSVTASGVSVTDTVPALVTVGSWNCVASAGGSCGSVTSGTGNAIALSGATIPVGGSITIAVSGTVQISATGNIVNTATVACGYTSCNKSSTVTNANAGNPQLSIVKQATPTAFAVGATGTYTLQVTNSNALGSSSTTGVITVSDPMPVGITMTGLPTGTGWNCSASTGTLVTCTTSAVLTPGASAPVISVPVAIAQNAANPSVNTATVMGGGDPVCTASANPVPAQCQGTTTTTVNAPRLDLVKTSGGAFTVGQAASYTIVVTNNGQAATSAAATVVDNIPAGLVIGTPLPNGCTVSGQAVSCTIPAGLAVGGQASFTVTVTPDGSVNGQQVANTANVQGGGDPTCPAATHCNSTTTNTVSAPQLSLTKTSTPNAFVVGQAGSYTLKVLNNGTAPTTGNAVVSDTIPAGLTIGTLPAGCTATGQQISCNVAAGLAVNASTSFTIPVTATAAVDGQTVQNAATATGGGDPGCTATTSPLPARCQAQVPVPVESAALHVAKTASTASFSVGVAASYTIKVTNVGTADTSGGWSVTDVVPGGLTIGTLPSGCTASGQQVTCSSSAVIVAGDATGVSFVIPVTPTAAAAPSVTNTATVQGGGDPHCPMPNNANCTSTITTPVNAPSLQLTKISNGPWVVGQSGAAYTLTVTNASTQAVTTGQITVADSLPAGIVAASGTYGNWTCSVSGQSVNCQSTTSIAPGGSDSIALPVTVDASAIASGMGASVTNNASVGGGGDPFNGGNPPAPGSSCTTLDAATPGHCASNTTTVNTPAALVVGKGVPTITGTATLGQYTATYIVTVINGGGVPSMYTLSDTPGYPAGITFNGWTVTAAGGGVVNTPLAAPVNGAATPLSAANVVIAAGGTHTYTVTITFTTSPSLSTVALTCTGSAGSGAYNAASINAGASTSANCGPLPGMPSLSLAKTNNGPWVVAQAGAKYTLTVTNSGNAATAGAITISDYMPVGIIAASGTYGGWSCTAAGQSLSCTSVTTINPGGQSVIDLPVTIEATALSSSVTNTAGVGGGGDPFNGGNPPDPQNCSDAKHCASSTTAVTTNVIPQPDLGVTKINGTNSVSFGGITTYTITISNSGQANATGVSWTDTVINGLSDVTLVSKTGDGKGSDPGTCAGLTCTGITVVAGGTVTYMVSGTVTGKVGDQAVNMASLIGGQCTAQSSTEKAATGSCTSTDSDEIVGTKIVEIPANSRLMLVALGLLMILFASLQARMSGKRHAQK